MANTSLPTLFKSAIATIFFFSTSISAGNHSSPRPISDEEISSRKQECYADIESGLWGGRCRSSLIEKENCALKCVSPVCYQLIYEIDPLEEGEKDYIRSQEFRYCMRRSSVGLNLDQVKGAFDNEVTVRAAAFSIPGSVRVKKVISRLRQNRLVSDYEVGSTSSCNNLQM